MYSWEIEKLLKLKNYLISNKDYFDICLTSPQIKVIKYQDFDDSFYIETEDKYHFHFKVYKK